MYAYYKNVSLQQGRNVVILQIQFSSLTYAGLQHEGSLCLLRDARQLGFRWRDWCSYTTLRLAQ